MGLSEELMQWKKDQRQFEISELDKEQFEIYGSDKLEIIKKWCEDLAEIICNMRQLAKQLEDLMPSKDVNVLLLKILTLLQNLVTGTFIIEKQPQQVLRTDRRPNNCNNFSAKVSLLVGKIFIERKFLSVNVS